MRDVRQLVIWVAVGLAGAGLLAWSSPQVLPLIPGEWRTARADAEVIALERLRDLGEPVADPYLVTRLRSDPQLERRLQILAGEEPFEVTGLRSSELAKTQLAWDIEVYRRSDAAWTYQAWISRDGEVLALRKSFPDRDADPEGDPEILGYDRLRELAAEFLTSAGFDPADF